MQLPGLCSGSLLADEVEELVKRPFGADSRAQMLRQYFDPTKAVTFEGAWQHVYRLLLWIDRTTGLAHCYESDKAQPGRPWYVRSLRFHAWLAEQLGVPPDQLSGAIDWLFRSGAERLARAAAELEARRASDAATQRGGYEGFPVPGEDAKLQELLLEQFRPWLGAMPPQEALLSATRRLQAYFGQENKRKNLVGEGFEDVLAAVAVRLRRSSLTFVQTRPFLHDIPGFREPPRGEKPRKVDLAVVSEDGRRTLVSAKWSVRADREEQFGVDFEAYARMENAGEDFNFVLVTNEFDAARLVAACDRRRPGTALFSSVVHVNPEGPLAVYGNEGRGAAARLPALVDSSRIISLERWLRDLLK